MAVSYAPTTDLPVISRKPIVLRARPQIIESTFDRIKYGFTTILSYHILWW
jgi:hypothetical protein